MPELAGLRRTAGFKDEVHPPGHEEAVRPVGDGREGHQQGGLASQFSAALIYHTAL